ncbi:MAG TPA: hypothetical protein VNJ12_05935 [Candidatus Dormibacteraeota bacterium]|nr:hypothetical protein [Candidatus Dormibacteraeota bacterium]
MPGKPPSAKAIGLMAALFVLGGLVGGFGAVVLRHMDHVPRHERTFDRLSRELQLTARQQGEVHAIFAGAHKRFAAVFQQSQDEVQPRYDAIRKDVHARIRAILTPAQQVKFDAFLKRLDSEHKIHPPPIPGTRRDDR